MARSHKRGKICVPSLLAGVALGAMIIYLGSSTIRAAVNTAANGVAMSVGGCPYTVDVTGQPYSVANVPGLINFPTLPGGMTSVTGVYPPATGPY